MGRKFFIYTLAILFYWVTDKKNCSSNSLRGRRKKGWERGRGTLQSKPDTCFALFKIKGMNLKRA